MRTIDDIDADLRVLATVRVGLREFGTVSSITTMDRLLDERLAAGGHEAKDCTTGVARGVGQPSGAT